MNGKFRTYRSLHSELVSLVVAVAVPGLLFFSFPFGALHSFPPGPEIDSKPSCSFVMLTPVEEHEILMSARAAWQLDRGRRLHMSIDLFVDVLPPLPPRAVLARSARLRADRLAGDMYVPDPLPPTLAAPPPATIALQPDADAVTPAFPRSELLKLN